MYLKSFTINNFLEFDNQQITFNELTKIDNINILKSFYIFKYLVTLSEEHPELATLVTNEEKPFKDKETIFKVNLEINKNNYTYQINVFNNEIVYEELNVNKINIFKRLKNEVLLEENPILWNCGSNKFKSFLNTCATENNLHGEIFYYFLKENIDGIAPWIAGALKDATTKLFSNEEDILIDIIKEIPICSNQNLINYTYNTPIENLNQLIKYRFNNINDLNTRKFLKLNIYFNWLNIVGGGILIIDDKDYNLYIDYIEEYQKVNNNIQVIIK